MDELFAGLWGGLYTLPSWVSGVAVFHPVGHVTLEGILNRCFLSSAVIEDRCMPSNHP